MAEPATYEQRAEDRDGRPTKKARLELPTTITLDVPGTPIDDMDDASIYGMPSNAPTPQPRQDDTVLATKQTVEDQPQPVTEPAPHGGIPGLGLLGNSVEDIYYHAPTPEAEHSGLSPEHINGHGKTGEEASASAPEIHDTDQSMGIKDSIETDDAEVDLSSTLTIEQSKDLGKVKGSLDPEFLRAAETNKSNPNAEWQFDSSDAESSSSDNSSDSSDSDDSEGSEEGADDDDDYQLLNPEEQARILMQEEGGSDDEDGKKQGKTGLGPQLRTKNEIAEAKVEKPNIAVTDEMKVEELGTVEQIVDNLVLIKAKVSGEYQVLDSGSLLCLENRKVFGVVGETLGRVQQPLYSVRFNSAAEIVEEGVALGTKVFYVDQHSTYVFTQPLKALKGSDASNIHDEEVGEDELEFSDDEAEAAYKRRVRQERESRKVNQYHDHGHEGRQGERSRHGRGGFLKRSFSDTKGHMRREDTDGDDLYTPLARPTNLHELMGNGEAPVEARNHRALPSRPPQGMDRDRDWGRGGRADRMGRGGRRGSAVRTDRRGHPGGNHELSGSNYVAERFGAQDQSPPPPSSSGNQNNSQTAPQQQFAPATYYPQQPFPFFQQSTQYPPQASQITHQQEQLRFPQFYSPNQEHQPYSSWSQAPVSPQHPGFPFSATPQNYLPQSPGAALPSPGGTIPPGSFVNPAFFRNQPQGQWAQSQPKAAHVQPQAQTGAGRMSPEAEAAFKAAQEKLDILKGLSGAHGSSGSGWSG